MSSEKVVTAALLWKNGMLLVARRATGEHKGKWEFPGGKVELNETDRECLARELKEELQIEASIGKFVAENRFDYGAGAILLRAFMVDSFKGIMRPVVHDALEWVLPVDLRKYDLLPADVPIADQIARGVDDLRYLIT